MPSTSQKDAMYASQDFTELWELSIVFPALLLATALTAYLLPQQSALDAGLVSSSTSMTILVLSASSLALHAVSVT